MGTIFQMSEKDKLYNLIVNNKNLEILESKIEVFNPFKILSIENYEIRHSNVLAWLLDPDGSHRMGQYFLKKVLTNAVLTNENTLGNKIRLDDIYLADYSDAVVKREEKHIDIMVLSERNKFLLLIENKVHAKESKHQLTKYLEYAKKKYHEHKIIPILLTKSGDEPEFNDEYGVLSHELIYNLIKETLELQSDYLTTEVENFIRFYTQTLEKVLGMDEDLKKLCRSIYEEHKDAIDLIVQATSDDETSLKEAFESLLKKYQLENLYLSDRVFWFLPEKLTAILPEKDLGWRVPYPIGMWISKKDEKAIKFHIEIGPFKSSSERINFLEFLEQNGYSIRSNAKRIESRYTRVVTNTIRVNDFEDKEELEEKVDMIYQKNLKKIEGIIEIASRYGFVNK